MNRSRPDCIADTSVVVRLLRGDSPVEQKIKGKNFAITFVTLAELDVGILSASDQLAAGQRCLDVLKDRQVFNGSGRTPKFYAHIYLDLKRRGKMIPINDIWIAAMALETSLPVLVRDEHFSRVKGISIIRC